ncbi:MAG: CinA family protein [Desulfobacterales bacterium]|nr:CinA family protein [Desulfobacterales bacterium]
MNAGLVTYSNAAKISMLGVPAEIIEKHGAVSEETARLMAEGVRRNLPEQIWVCLPPALPDRPAAARKNLSARFIWRWPTANRPFAVIMPTAGIAKETKHVSSEAALFLLKNYLQGKV